MLALLRLLVVVVIPLVVWTVEESGAASEVLPRVSSGRRGRAEMDGRTQEEEEEEGEEGCRVRRGEERREESGRAEVELAKRSEAWREAALPGKAGPRSGGGLFFPYGGSGGAFFRFFPAFAVPFSMIVCGERMLPPFTL